MKIKYEIDDSLQEDEVIIKFNKLSDKILKLERILNSDQVESVIGTKNSKIFPIKTPLIERIYIENRRTMIFSKGEVYETKKTLSEFEIILGKSFVRISKSEIANTKLIKSIESEFSGNPDILAREAQAALSLVEQLELALAKAERRDDTAVRSSVKEEIPEQHREIVADYYRKLGQTDETD